MPSEDTWLPLYQGMMFQNYDHRAADIVHSEAAAQRQNQPSAISLEEHQDPNRVALPMYWLPKELVEQSLGDYDRDWWFGFANVTSPTNMKTLKITVFPRLAAGHSVQLLLPKRQIGPKHCAALLACLNSSPFDWVARNKIGGVNFSFFIVEQLPVLPPESYTPAILELIVPRVIELTYTAWDLQPFALDCGYDGPPYVWDEERRTLLRAELDGIYAHLYGLNRDEFAYVLDTFPIVERKDQAAYGEYRTKRLCLEAYAYFDPETLIELDTEVKAIETGLRKLIVQQLGQSPAVLQEAMREKLLERQVEHLKGKVTHAHTSSLPALLESAYLFDLQKIMCHGDVWSKFEVRFGPKSELQRSFTRLGEMRNPLAHSRSMSEEQRKDGEAAVAWFQERLE